MCDGCECSTLLNGIYFRIVGHAKDLALSRKKAQQEVCDCIKANPNIRQFEIVQKLERSKQNVSRAVDKLIRDGPSPETQTTVTLS